MYLTATASFFVLAGLELYGIRGCRNVRLRTCKTEWIVQGGDLVLRLHRLSALWM